MGIAEELHQQHKERVARMQAAAFKAVTEEPKRKTAPVKIPIKCQDDEVNALRMKLMHLLHPRTDHFLSKAVQIRRIREMLCETYGVSMLDLESARRNHHESHIRQIGMYLAKKLTRWSLPEIGRHFGKRDHTTVLYAIRKVGERRQKDAALDAQLTAFEKALSVE